MQPITTIAVTILMAAGGVTLLVWNGAIARTLSMFDPFESTRRRDVISGRAGMILLGLALLYGAALRILTPLIR